MIYGYIRVSTDRQTVENQRDGKARKQGPGKASAQGKEG